VTGIPNGPLAPAEIGAAAHPTTGRLAASVALSTVAGFVDGAAFVLLGGYFVSFMSGNTTQSAADLTDGVFGAAAYGALLVLAFVVGAVAGTATAVRWGARGVLILVAGTLAVAACGVLLTSPLPWGMVLAAGMGAMNTVFSHTGSAPLGLTYMTGQLMKLAEGIVAALRGRGNAGWVRPLLLWLGIAVGAVLGAAAARAFGAPALAIPTVAMVAAAVLAAIRRPRP
jgi:uncharacterized membrane protein YoaK (UPF0700 family)